MNIILIFPTQLFENIQLIKDKQVYLIEEPIYFTDYNYHKLKLAYHRATMKYYYDYLKKNKINVKYVEFKNITNKFYQNIKPDKIYIYDPLEHKLLNKLKKIYNNKLFIFPTLNFLVYSDLKLLKNNIFKNNYSFKKFYIYYRKKFNILLKADEIPVGNKWSFDEDNRNKIPSGTILPEFPKVINNKYTKEATNYINKYFKNNYGDINFIYPITHKQSKNWFNSFLKYKLDNFGEYEDATIEDHPFLFHSILTPMLNIGLLTDKYILNNAFNYKTKIQNIEGFIRQIFWRNYMMTIYMIEKPIIKNKIINYKIYHKIWYGKTGMYPIDYMIKNYIIPYAYSHHITRLLYFGNFFKLCLLKDNLIYKWFMEAYIDAYSWVMFGNIYGMVLNRIKIMTKNYIASSNYIFKMSNIKNVDNWKKIFDALYYNFININYKELKIDYSLRYQLAYWNKKTNKQEIIDTANYYIQSLYNIST
jgi:deoxyribodipyrimidine photolyase-related protein